MKTVIAIRPDGSVAAIPGDARGEELLKAIGLPPPKRASHVEPIQAGVCAWQWMVDMSPLGTAFELCLWPPFPSREAALAAEHDFIVRYWLNDHGKKSPA